jgi:DNA repair exonuclease SbcCD nuclease subunit
MSWLNKCHINGIAVHLIMGNHDTFRNGSVYNSILDVIAEANIDNVSIYKNIDTITIGLTSFTLLPFRDRKSFGVPTNQEAVSIVRDSLAYELVSIPNNQHKVVVGHLAIEGSIPVGDELDDIANEIFCPLDMFNGYDAVWCGHIHVPQVMQKSNPYIAHIGSMDISNFGENNHKKHIILYDCENGSWTEEVLPTRQLKKVCLTIPKDTEDTTAYVLDELKKLPSIDRSIFKLEIGLEAPELISVNKQAIEKYLTSQGVFNVVGISESRKLTLIKKDDSNTIDTKMDVPVAIKTYATAYIEKSEQSAFIELALDIYHLLKTEGKE